MAEERNTGRNPSASTPGPEGAGRKTFRCADVGFADCRWEVSGPSSDELMPQIEQHGRESHGINQVDDKIRQRIHHAIRDRAA